MMPKTTTSSATRNVRRIAIDGHFLDEVQTRLHADPSTQSASAISAPVERHQAFEDEQGVTLKLPALTALQLYADGILPAAPRKAVEITIAGRKLGAFYVHSLVLVPGHEFGSPVLLRFERKPAKKARPADPNAWLTRLEPLALHAQGHWDPADEYWGEEGEPIGDWAKPIIKRGRRPVYEMEQVLPGDDPEDFDSDPILQANDLKDRGQIARARKLLEKLLIADIRCLDAHAHLGNLVFDQFPSSALSYYQRGVAIGDLSLGEDFTGLLPWSWINNRPFLRCLNGAGITLWRLDRFEEAEAVLKRLLWLSPSDNLGIRFLLPQVQARISWTPDAP
jgi:hypothetical protein